MLVELHVEQMGVIEDMTLLLGDGMTAVTGETGAGKTLVVEAIELLVGGRADPVVVRAGADAAAVEGRFVIDDEELVLSRVVPRNGRSRAYINGRLATVANLAELAPGLVDLYGQHAGQSLVQQAVQRAALDRFGAVDLRPLREASERVVELTARLAALGGDERARVRELDLLGFQRAEIAAAAITSLDEDAILEREEDLLADAQAHREAAARAGTALTEEGGAIDGVREALATMSGRTPFAGAVARLRSLVAELDDVATETRSAAEAITDEPERLALVRARRQLLHDLCRKYGDDLGAVLAYRDDIEARINELESHEARAAQLETERAEATKSAANAAAAVGAARRKAAPRLAKAIEQHVRTLALGRARLAVEVGDDDPGDDVRFLFAADAGEAPLPLSKIASGGELARTMLALRLVLTDAPPTLIFDEVDAGVGGEAALSVGRALQALSGQVLVVTHLAQVAAFADTHVVITKAEHGGRTAASALAVDGAARVAELSRMMTGLAESGSAQRHVCELLALAGRPKGR
jgi:DNA repair protein RecN (Recombination protein N)